MSFSFEDEWWPVTAAVAWLIVPTRDAVEHAAKEPHSLSLLLDVYLAAIRLSGKPSVRLRDDQDAINLLLGGICSGQIAATAKWFQRRADLKGGAVEVVGNTARLESVNATGCEFVDDGADPDGRVLLVNSDWHISRGSNSNSLRGWTDILVRRSDLIAHHPDPIQADRMRPIHNPTAAEYVASLAVQPPVGVGPIRFDLAVAWVASTYADLPTNDFSERWRRAAKEVCDHASADKLVVRGTRGKASPVDIEARHFEEVSASLPWQTDAEEYLGIVESRELCLLSNRLDLRNEPSGRVTFEKLTVQRETINEYWGRIRSVKKSKKPKQDTVIEAIAALWPSGIPSGISEEFRHSSISKWFKANARGTVSKRTVLDAIKASLHHG